MGIRETLNKNPAIATGATIAIILVALGAIVYQLLPNRPHIVTKSWYSDDDGVTYFRDELNKIPPFDHNGKEAVRCFVYKWKGGKFVGYLQKYSDEGKKKMEAAQADKNNSNPMIMMETEGEILIKKPGADGKWINEMRDPNESMKVYSVKAPDGSDSPVEAVPAD